jgi:hypothetical protein
MIFNVIDMKSTMPDSGGSNENADYGIPLGWYDFGVTKRTRSKSPYHDQLAEIVLRHVTCADLNDSL